MSPPDPTDVLMMTSYAPGEFERLSAQDEAWEKRLSLEYLPISRAHLEEDLVRDSTNVLPRSLSNVLPRSLSLATLLPIIDTMATADALRLAVLTISAWMSRFRQALLHTSVVPLTAAFVPEDGKPSVLAGLDLGSMTGCIEAFEAASTRFWHDLFTEEAQAPGRLTLAAGIHIKRAIPHLVVTPEGKSEYAQGEGFRLSSRP